jgi:hypothetical protein
LALVNSSLTFHSIVCFPLCILLKLSILDCDCREVYHWLYSEVLIVFRYPCFDRLEIARKQQVINCV